MVLIVRSLLKASCLIRFQPAGRQGEEASHGRVIRCGPGGPGCGSGSAGDREQAQDREQDREGQHGREGPGELRQLGATAHELLARFPEGVITGDAELAARVAGDQLARGSLQEAERYLALASQRLDSVPADRRGRSRVVVAVVRMRLARQRGDLPAVAEEAERLLAPGVMTDLAEPRQGGDLRALALINLGIAEAWTARFDDADRHLENGIALAHEIGRPYLEVTGLAHWAQLGSWRSFPLGAQRSRQAIELAERHGWADEPITGFAHLALGVAMVTQGRLEEAEQALGRAERIVMAEVEPAAGMRLHYGRGMLEFVSGRHAARLPGGRTAGQLAPHTAHRTRSPRGCARTCCRHSCGQAKRGASSNSSRP
jgi:LuxR family transcriptional regulator, maltose regulon positive regulatory protein